MINTAWYQGAKLPSDKEKVQALVENSEILLDKLKIICYNIIKDNEKINKLDYQSPGWAFEQAHLNGENAALRKIIDIITVTERP